MDSSCFVLHTHTDASPLLLSRLGRRLSHFCIPISHHAASMCNDLLCHFAPALRESSSPDTLVVAYTCMMVVVIRLRCFICMRMEISRLVIGLHDITISCFSLCTKQAVIPSSLSESLLSVTVRVICLSSIILFMLLIPMMCFLSCWI